MFLREEDIKPSKMQALLEEVEREEYTTLTPVMASYVSDNFSSYWGSKIKNYIKRYNLDAKKLDENTINAIKFLVQAEINKKNDNYFELKYGVKGFTHVPPGYEKDYGSKEWKIRHGEI